MSRKAASLSIRLFVTTIAKHTIAIAIEGAIQGQSSYFKVVNT